ncbi:MAG: PHB depolymerase family esterase [Pseudomonadota bacterium]
MRRPLENRAEAETGPGAGAGSAGEAGPPAALLFIHGWRGSASGVMRNAALTAFADEIGAALIAPEGLETTWSYPGSPSQARDEFAFFDALNRDLQARHGVAPAQMVVSGFSMGASMAWSLACRRGGEYAGFIAFAGAFWEPLPPRCADRPAALIHIHGTSDQTVPIGGRPIGLRFAQGDVFESFAVLRETGAASTMRPETRAGTVGGPQCRTWADTPTLLFCHHDGGHFWRVPWLRAAWARLRPTGSTPKRGSP